MNSYFGVCTRVAPSTTDVGLGTVNARATDMQMSTEASDEVKVKLNGDALCWSDKIFFVFYSTWLCQSMTLIWWQSNGMQSVCLRLLRFNALSVLHV